jgi:hypothetical protein
VKIGLIVDGVGEVDALPGLFDRIATPHQLLKPVPGRFQPLALPERTALLAARECRALAANGAELVVMLLDRETRNECPGSFAPRLQRLIARRLSGLSLEIAVVLEDRTFENWLVADPTCFRQMPRLFPEAQRILRAVPRGNADGIDGLAMLRRASGSRGRYDKVQGAVAICTHLDPGRAALNSRSFRRFLRMLGDSRYAAQSRLPNDSA